jgi:formylglycine-generating enzyme required for sulfatase activity
MTNKSPFSPAILIVSISLLAGLCLFLAFSRHGMLVGKGKNAPVSGKASARTQARPGMVWIPGGKFLMGSPEGVGNLNEHPQHEVRVDGFYMDTTEVTQKQYKRVMGENPSHFKDCPTCPVENVTWHEARTYCEKMGKQLPTEAQWEYACRAGSASINYWTDTSAQDYAWYRDNSGQKTHPVGQKKPNNYGLYDMIGNVWEWCGDWFDSTYYEKKVSDNPKGPDSDMHRIFRGASWQSDPSVLRSAARDGAVPEDQSYLFGFRCVCQP